MARNKTKPEGRTRRSERAPDEVPCGYCHTSVAIESVKHKRYRWLSGQRNFFCGRACSHQANVGRPNPSATETMSGNKYAVGREPPNKHTLDSRDFFDVIDTECKAYYLGLIFADGSVICDGKGKYRLALSLNDPEPVYGLKEALGASAPVTKRHYPAWTNAQYCLVVSDKQMVQDLVRQGAIQNKTLTLQFPRGLPESLVRHFIRGYMDGDGHVCCLKENGKTILRVSFYGTDDLVRGCVEYLYREVQLKSGGTFQHGKLTQFSRSQLQADKVLSHLYEGSQHFLKRKKDKYLQWLACRNEEQELKQICKPIEGII